MIKLFEMYEKSKYRKHIEKNPGLVAILIGVISISLTIFGLNSNFSANQKTSVIMLLPIATEVQPYEILNFYIQEF